MRRSTKAVLLSAFVFPGAGHLFLKHYLRGAALMGLATAGLAVIVVKTVQQAMLIVEQLESGRVALDPASIAALFPASASGAEGVILDLASYGILLCWGLGIFDSYRIGTRHEALGHRDTAGR